MQTGDYGGASILFAAIAKCVRCNPTLILIDRHMAAGMYLLPTSDEEPFFRASTDNSAYAADGHTYCCCGTIAKGRGIG